MDEDFRYVSDSEIEIDGVTYYRKADMSEAVRSEDPRVQLEALRDYLAHELDGNRCSRCQMSQLKTGDTAALVLRLQKVLEEIQSIPLPDTGDKTGIAKISDGKAIKNARMRDEMAQNRKSEAAGSRRASSERRTGGRR